MPSICSLCHEKKFSPRISFLINFSRNKMFYNAFRKPVTLLMLKIILYEPSVFMHQALIYHFISQGIVIKLAINKNKLIELSNEIPNNVILASTETDDRGMIEVITQIKQNQYSKTIGLFPLINKLERRLLKTLKRAGVDGLIFKTRKPHHVLKQVLLHCDINDLPIKDYRLKNGIHIQPNRQDFAQVSIRTLEIFQTLTADVGDISFNSIIFKFRERTPYTLMKKNSLLKKMFVFLKNYKIETSGIILGVQDNFVITRLTDMSHYDQHALCMYIHDNINQILEKDILQNQT